MKVIKTTKLDKLKNTPISFIQSHYVKYTHLFCLGIDTSTYINSIISRSEQLIYDTIANSFVYDKHVSLISGNKTYDYFYFLCNSCNNNMPYCVVFLPANNEDELVKLFDAKLLVLS